MKLHVKYDSMTVCKAVVTEQLEKLGIPFTFQSHSELEIKSNLSAADQENIRQILEPYGIEIVDEPVVIFVQKIKDLILEMIHSPDQFPSAKFSDYLSRQLHHSYGHISKTFSDVTYTSIEHFIILQKIEKAKQMINTGAFTLTEISWKLNYSSVQHLSNQFKKTTGITPSAFQRIVKERQRNKSLH